MILVKEGVRFKRLLPEIYNLFPVLEFIFGRHGLNCVITCAHDSHEDKPGSLHNEDLAIDLRSKHVPTSDQKHSILDELRHRSGGDYDILLEFEGLEREHYHLEFDPR